MIQKFRHTLKKELLYYFIILIILALVMHGDLLSEPLLRLETMQEKGNYLHPFLYSFVVYSVILFLRGTINLVSKIFEKKQIS